MFKKERKCVICGKTFLIQAPNQRVCSRGCKKLLNKKARKRQYKRHKKAKMEYRNSHKDYYRTYARNFYRKNKRELINFMGGKCVMCGLTPTDVEGCLGVFVIDEIEPLKEIKHRTKFSSLTKKRLERAKQLFLEEKLQLLCQNCSAIKTWKNNDYGKRMRK